MCFVGQIDQWWASLVGHLLASGWDGFQAQDQISLQFRLLLMMGGVWGHQHVTNSYVALTI